MITVRCADPARQTILGHMLGSLVERGARDPRVAAGLARRRHSMLLSVSGMVCTIELAGPEVVIHTGDSGAVKAELHSDMCTLVNLARGDSLVHAVLSRRLRLRGNPLRLLSLLPLLRPPQGQDEE